MSKTLKINNGTKWMTHVVPKLGMIYVLEGLTFYFTKNNHQKLNRIKNKKIKMQQMGRNELFNFFQIYQI